jgi:hypothetical protein
MSLKTVSKLLALAAFAAAALGLVSRAVPGSPFRHDNREAAAQPAAGEESEALVTPYPAARWRLASPSQLGHALLWGAHILIAHRDVLPGAVPFKLPEWRPAWPGPERSRRDAWLLAESLARQARSDPEKFARLARDHSEDAATKDLGGSLGTVSADQLREWPEVLDAFAALGFGEVSRVVESDFGFHVLLRKPPPAEQRVGAARLVLAYDRAPWLHRFLGYRPIPSRSRSEAFELGRSLYQRLREHPEDFERLVREHSDHRDALRGGDFGEWSTREPTPFSREIEVLAALPVGQVAEPIDSPFGVEILKRTPERARARFAMAALEQNFDPRLPDNDPASRTSVRKTLAALLPAPGKSAAGALDSQLQLERVLSWVEGRGDAADEIALRQLAFGELATELVERGSSVAIVRRLEPQPEPAPPVRLDLPAPESPDLEYWLSHYGSARLFAAVERRACAEPSLMNAAVVPLERLSRYGALLEKAPSTEAAAALVRELRLESVAILGSERSSEYLKVLTGYVEERLLRVTPHPGHPATLDGLPLRRWPVL